MATAQIHGTPALSVLTVSSWQRTSSAGWLDLADGLVRAGHSAVQCSAVQCSAVQCSAVQCSADAVQCSAVQCSAVTVQRCLVAVQCSAGQCSWQRPHLDKGREAGRRHSLTAGTNWLHWHRTALGHCTALTASCIVHCTALHCRSALHCHCTALHYSKLYSH